MPITGYSSTTSVRQGRTIYLHLGHSDGINSENVALKLESVSDSSISAIINVVVEPRDRPANQAWEGYNWPISTRFRIPRNWASGFYRLLDNNSSEPNTILHFVVLPRLAGSTSKILLQISYLTPAAYNWVDEKSFYKPPNESGSEERARKVSLNRPSPYPNTSASLNFKNEIKLIQWLAEEGITVECCTSIDLHASSSLLKRYDCMVIAYHDEYWTKAMRDHCEAFIRNSGNLIVLSGNTCYRQVRLEDNNRTVVFYKYAGLDRDPPPISDETAIAWAQPPVNRPQNDFLGVGFTQGAFFPTGAWAAYDIHFPQHWVFGGVTASSTSAFMHYEVDAAAVVVESEGYPRVTGEEGTPINTTILASADATDWQKPGKATMSLYSRNGTVFNAATTDWIAVLGSDAVVTQVTRNVFAKLKQPVPWDWELIGHAEHASAMTALNGIIYLSTSYNDLWRRFPIGADVPWRKIGHANRVVAMAAGNDTLFCITQSNVLWWRPPILDETNWVYIGYGPASGTKAMAVAGSMLYVVDNNGALHRRPANRRSGNFVEQRFSPDTSIRALTSYSDILIASTTDNRLLRTNRDNVAESDAWHQFHHCNFSIGLAVVDWMLYVVTTDNWLWRIDLSGIKTP